MWMAKNLLRIALKAILYLLKCENTGMSTSLVTLRSNYQDFLFSRLAPPPPPHPPPHLRYMEEIASQC